MVQKHMYVDHFLQTEMLSRLMASDRPLRFSELKEEGIENSLFMYHANKLLARGILRKTEDGFALTVRGANFINSVSARMISAMPTPKPLIQFVIRDGEGNILLSRRQGQMAALLNSIMLPGGLHKAGVTAEENAKRIFSWWFEDIELRLSFLTFVETISRYKDEFIYHSLAHIFSVQLKEKIMPSNDERFIFEWVAIKEVHASDERFSEDAFLPNFIEKLQAGRLSTRETMILDYDK